MYCTTHTHTYIHICNFLFSPQVWGLLTHAFISFKSSEHFQLYSVIYWLCGLYAMIMLLAQACPTMRPSVYFVANGRYEITTPFVL